MQIYFAIPPNSAFHGLLEEFLFIYQKFEMHNILTINLLGNIYISKQSLTIICSVRKYRTSAFAHLCARGPYYIIRELKLPPHHLIHDTHIALDNLHYLGAYVLIYVVRHRDSMLTVLAELYSSIYSLQQTLRINTRNNEISLINGLRTLSACANADSRERMPHRGKER